MGRLSDLTKSIRINQCRSMAGLPKPIRPQPGVVAAVLCCCCFIPHTHLPHPHAVTITESSTAFPKLQPTSPALRYRHRGTGVGDQGEERTHVCINLCAKHRGPVRWLVFTVGWTINPRKQFIHSYCLYQGSTGRQAAFLGDFKCLHLVRRWQQ